jgi:hypothetical protein
MELSDNHAPDTHTWYTSKYGCLITDPTVISRTFTFPGDTLTRHIPQTPAPLVRITNQYRTAWPSISNNDMEQNYPQFAFRPGTGPASVAQVDVESQLRRLDQPLGHCTQGIIPFDSPLFSLESAIPPPPSGVPENVQNAANPVAAMIRQIGAEQCRNDADKNMSALSNRTFNNPTRQDTRNLTV